MNKKEEIKKSRENLQEEIFKTCEKENRQPDTAEIIILSNIEEQRFFEKICPGVCQLLADKSDRR